MTPRYPTLAVLGLAGACALLSATAVYSNEAPTTAAEPSPVAKALDELETLAPKEWKDPAAIAANHARVIALIETNTLQSGPDFQRAAILLQMHLGEFRIVRMQYELTLASAAKGEVGAEKALSFVWDQLMGQISRPYRFDFHGWAQKNPEFAEFEPTPVCVQTVWRDAAAALSALADVADNAEIQTIRDADQADRLGNWTNRTAEERTAIMARDKARNARMREIVANGEVRTANDFARAALVMQHSARFDGFRLAHELAVAALLLGDRGTGRWLTTATYDRMLRSVGLDQRFGTQMGPDGPLRVDEAGICDNQRIALGCPTLAQARGRRAQGSQIVDKLTQEITKPGRFIHDAKTGVSATYPEAWRVTNASATGKATFIRLESPDHASVPLTFYYRLLDAPQPTGAEEAATLLRKQALEKDTDRRSNVSDYTNRPDSFVLRQINGRHSLSWIGDYERDGVKWCEYLVRILGGNSVGLLFLHAPADQIESLRPVVDAMADTVQLP